MKYRITFLTICLSLFCLAISLHNPTASAAGAVDQQQPTIDITVGGLAIGGGSEQKLAQVVSAGVAGRLTEVRFPVFCGDTGNLIVEIQGVTGDQPNGIVLATLTVPATSLPGFYPDPPVFRSFAFSTPASFGAGEKFAIVLKSDAICVMQQGPEGNSYMGGGSFYDSRPNPPGWVPNGPREDLPFQTLVESAPTVTTVGIDILPGVSPNAVYPSHRILRLFPIPVAVLSTPGFDARTVNPSTVRFGANGTENAPTGVLNLDVDGDGDIDRVFFFRLPGAGITCDTTSAKLNGTTSSGQAIQGSDSIVTRGC